MLAASQTSAKGQISTAWNQSMRLHSAPSAIGRAKQRPLFHISKETQPEISPALLAKPALVTTQRSPTWQCLHNLSSCAF